MFQMEMEGLTTSQTNLFTTFKHFITSPSMRLALIVSICLHLSQQLSGFGAILSYSTETFSHAGINNGDIATAVLGVVLVLGTIATIVLIEYVGRRPLMLYGLGGMSVFFLLVSSAFCFQFAFYEHYTGVTAPSVLLIIFTFGTTVAFSIGPGAIPWLMVAEMFQQDARSFAVSIATIVNWLSNFVVTFLFPFMLTELKPYPFIIFAAVCGLFWLFMYFFLPETKGRTIDEIIQHFKDVTSSNKKPPLHVQEKKE
jgi:MFS family permease